MNDQGTILVVSSVPTAGYMIMNGLVQIGVFVICAAIAYYLLKKAGFDLLSFLRGEKEDDDPRNKSKSKSGDSKSEGNVGTTDTPTVDPKCDSGQAKTGDTPQ